MIRFLLKPLACLVLFFISCTSLSLAQECGTYTSLTLKAGKNIPFISTLMDNLASKTYSNGDTSQSAIQAYTWTNNEHGVPLFNGRTLLKFDLSKVTIPANAVNVIARLYLYADLNAPDGVAGQPMYGSANACLLQRVTANWDIKHTNYDTVLSVSTTDQKILNQSTSTNQNYVITITDFVNKWISKPDSNYGMLLRMQTENNPYNSMLFKGTTGPDSLKPTIIISYTLPEPNATQAVIYGDLSGKFKSIVMGNSTWFADSTQSSIQAFTWTDNAHGVSQYNGRTLLWYDVSAVPANSIITNAYLYFYANLNAGDGVPGQPTYGTDNAGLLQKVTSRWQYGQTDFNHQPAVTTTAQKTLVQSTSTAQNYVIPITDFVQSWVNKPDSNFGVLLRMRTENNPYNSLLFTSAAAPTKLQSKIIICYKSALPVVLQNFQGSVVNFMANLSWTTYNEVNFAATSVEKSYTGTDFVAIGSVIGKSANAVNDYLFTDASLEAHRNKVYYRLKLVDKDGKYSYSNVLALNYHGTNEALTVSPNPARDYVIVSVFANKEGKTNLRLVDVVGKTVLTQASYLYKGTNKIMINQLDKLQKGLYLVQVVVDGTVQTRKVLVD